MEIEEKKIIEIGKVTHYFSRINVAAIKLKAPLILGDRILIKGRTTNFEQIVDSMQIQHKNIEKAEAGEEVGLKVKDKVRANDVVYKIL